MSALGDELLEALRSMEGRRLLVEVAREALRAELDAHDDDRLLDVEEVARITGRTVDAVYRAASRGSLPAVRHGRSLRFRRADVVGRGGRR